MYPALLLVCFFKMSGLNSIASKIAIKKLLRLITEANMASTVRKLFESRTENYFDTTITSVGVMLSIGEVLLRYDLFQYFESWFNDSTFPTYTDWKRTVRDKIQVFEGGRMVPVLQLSSRHACCSVLFRKICLSINFGP